MTWQSRLIVLAAAALAAASSVTPLPAGTAPDGFEFIVPNTTAYDQTRPIVASRGADGFVVAWTSFGQTGGNDDVFARLFNAAMFPQGAEFRVNLSTLGDQSEAKIGSNDSGEFIVAFTDWFGGDGSGEGVKARRYDSTGTPVGGEFVVNTYTTGTQFRPDVSMNGSGEFVVVWTSDGQDGDFFGVFGRMFDSTGSAVGSEFSVNTYTTGGQTLPQVSMDDTGGFVVVWNSTDGQDGAGSAVYGRRFDSAGSALGGEFRVNTNTAGGQKAGEVTHLPSGGFVVVWGDDNSLDGSGYSVRAQLFDSTGSMEGGEFQVNTTTVNNERFPSVDGDESGTFVVTWTSSTYAAADSEVFGQRFYGDGSPLGLEFQLNAHTPDIQRVTDVATDPDGDFVVAWIDETADGDGTGAVARRFHGNAHEILDPRPGDSVDCSDPRNIQPTFTWTPGDYDKFKVYMSATSNFLTGTYYTSGRKWIADTFWTAKRKKWKKICIKTLAVSPSSPVIYIRVLGKDRDVSKKDPARKINSFIVPVEPTY